MTRNRIIQIAALALVALVVTGLVLYEPPAVGYVFWAIAAVFAIAWFIKSGSSSAPAGAGGNGWLARLKNNPRWIQFQAWRGTNDEERKKSDIIVWSWISVLYLVLSFMYAAHYRAVGTSLIEFFWDFHRNLLWVMIGVGLVMATSPNIRKFPLRKIIRVNVIVSIIINLLGWVRYGPSDDRYLHGLTPFQWLQTFFIGSSSGMGQSPFMENIVPIIFVMSLVLVVFSKTRPIGLAGALMFSTLMYHGDVKAKVTLAREKKLEKAEKEKYAIPAPPAKGSGTWDIERVIATDGLTVYMYPTDVRWHWRYIYIPPCEYTVRIYVSKETPTLYSQRHITIKPEDTGRWYNPVHLPNGPNLDKGEGRYPLWVVLFDGNDEEIRDRSIQIPKFIERYMRTEWDMRE